MGIYLWWGKNEACKRLHCRLTDTNTVVSVVSDGNWLGNRSNSRNSSVTVVTIAVMSKTDVTNCNWCNGWDNGFLNADGMHTWGTVDHLSL